MKYKPNGMKTSENKAYLNTLFRLALFALFTTSAFAYNPLIYQEYTADPTACWFNNTMYIYCSHDLNGQTSYTMNNVTVMSSTDLVNWTDNGEPIAASNTSWAGYTWAPDCVFRNGYYYFYFTNGGGSIGVLRGTTPLGPFTDPRPCVDQFKHPGHRGNRQLFRSGRVRRRRWPGLHVFRRRGPR